MGKVNLKIIPRASSNRVDGPRQGRAVIYLTTPPVDNRANRALIDFLAEKLDLPKRMIRLVSGHSSRLKTVEIEDLEEKEILGRLFAQKGRP